ncbi:M23 family metallopeptidase [Psychromonas sp. PT13]|uniref:M23 family metallopeptidase n=1 Tax=Psychromonas sp. PT13 TaxID=3439547 RepID=UPI003EB78E14
MSITVIYSMKETQHTFSLTKKKLLVILFGFLLLIIASFTAVQQVYQQQLQQFKTITLQNNEISKAQEIQAIKSESDEKLLVLANKIGELQAQMNRLNALGERVIEKSQLPTEEFNLEMSVPEGGPMIEASELHFEYMDLRDQVNNIDQSLKKREKQFDKLEITLNHLHLNNQAYISGKPVAGKHAWLSSPFGARKDPFTGKLTQHNGVDIAGQTGMAIIATAAGVVTEAGEHTGYGFLVEIQHGNGMVTRYAHAKAVTVSIGDIVSKGQQIAIMGTTGRSTGPHVHYEVLRNGKPINPNYYIQRKAV